MNTTDKIMALADRYAHVYSFVGDDAMPKARQALHSKIEALVRDAERLEAANAALRADVAHKDAYAEQIGRELSKADSECKALREKAAMHDAIQRACAELPLGADLHIELENGAGTVRLYLPDTDADVTDFSSDLTFVQQINAAIDAAMQEKQS